MMKLSQDYVLVLDERQRQLRQSDFPIISDRFPFVIATSAEHAVEQARQATPCLVILVGEDHTWFKDQVRALRRSLTTPAMTIVALTESTSPRWQSEQETIELDGFLVKPLTDDILTSLVQSAIIKQSYR
jgi:AmiR/NasT family two-component response regulator